MNGPGIDKPTFWTCATAISRSRLWIRVLPLTKRSELSNYT